MRDLGERFEVEARGELVLRVVVVNAVREPDALQIDLECAERLRVAVARVVLDDLLEGALDRGVMRMLLSVDDLAALERGLIEVVQQLLRLEIERLEAGHSIAEDAYVRETFGFVGKIFGIARRGGRSLGGRIGGGRLSLGAAGGRIRAAGSEREHDRESS